MFLLGEAAKYILRAEFGDNWMENVKVIFAGDDTTDEDAMRVNVYEFGFYANSSISNFHELGCWRENSINLQSTNSNLINFMIACINRI